MGHHGEEMSPELSQAFKETLAERSSEDAIAELGAKMERVDQGQPLGPTGSFPHGAIDSSDLGAIHFSTKIHRGRVVMAWGRRIAWMGMTPDQARHLAEDLYSLAQAIDGVKGGP